ncbi:hypothetical protein FOCG_17910 [Fusarium oxysporum f. sp. radicis-lycopersici 26381]|nr:hypothetical protein FOCG_17910 [Fusarium oxysporum f. sp. radicis-lycopersici 26381]
MRHAVVYVPSQNVQTDHAQCTYTSVSLANTDRQYANITRTGPDLDVETALYIIIRYTDLVLDRLEETNWGGPTYPPTINTQDPESAGIRKQTYRNSWGGLTADVT